MKNVLKKILSVLLVAVLLFSTLPLSASAAERPHSAETEIREFNGHYYQCFSEPKISWAEAKARCERMGGHLATISSQEENDFIELLGKELKAPSSLIGFRILYYWIGGIKSNDEWKWITGEPFKFTHWQEGYPDNKWGNHAEEDRLMFQQLKGEWDDLSSEFTNMPAIPGVSDVQKGLGYICEWESPPQYYTIKNQIGNINLGPYAVKGATINILGNEIPLINIEASVKMDIGNMKIISDINSGTVQVLLGFDQGASANIEAGNDPSYWRNSYQEVKSMYQDLTGQRVDTTRLWNRYSALRGKLKKSNTTNMVINVNSDLAGYIEFKRRGNSLVFSEGGIMASFDANTSLRSYYGPCYVCLGLGVGADGTLSFTCENNKVNPQITISPSFTVSAGGGIGTRTTYAELDAYGTLEATIATAQQTPFRAGVDLGVMWSGYIIGKQIFNGSHSFAKMELYPNFGAPYAANYCLTPGLDASNSNEYEQTLNSAGTINRGYTNTASVYKRTALYSVARNSNTAEFTKENVYPLNEQTLVRFNDDTMLLVWIDDLGTKTNENMCSLMYSYYDGSVWSAPQTIYENGTNNDMPYVYSDGSYAYIIWQKATAEFPEGTDTTEMIKQYDLFETSFSAADKSFSTPIQINTDNAVFEMNPVIVGKDGAFCAAWIENSENNVYQMSGENTIHIVEYSASGECLSNKTAVTTNQVVSQLKLMEKNVCYTLRNENINTLFYNQDNSVTICDDVSDFDVSGNTIYYSSNGIIYSYTDDGTVTEYNSLSGIDNFKIADNGTEVKLLSLSLNSDFTKTLYISTLDKSNNEWSQPEVFDKGGYYIRKYSSVILSDGSVKTAFNYIDLNSGEEYQKSILTVKGKTEFADLSVNYIDFDDSQIENRNIDLLFEVENNSSANVSSFLVNIKNSQGDILSSETVDCSLAPFSKAQYSVQYMLSENYSGEEIFVQVLPTEFEDSNEENNMLSTTIECLHIFGEYTIESYPTKEQDGTIIQHCTKCGITANRKSIPYLAISGASLTLQSDLTLNYKVKKSLLENTEYDNPYILFEMNGVQTVVSDYSESGDYYVFSFKEIAPNQMNDTITATLYGSIGSELLHSDTVSYSVSAYCYNMLGKCAGDEYAKLRTLLVDLLNYGAQSQLYTNYNSEHLVTANLTEEQVSFGTSETPMLSSKLNTQFATIENPTVQWRGAGLVLENAVTMRFILTADDITDLSVKVSTSFGEWVIPYTDFVKTDGAYYVYFSELNAAQMREPIYMTAYDGNMVAVSNTVCYSVESYAYAKQDSTIPYLADLVKSMMKYGDSAYSYIQ